MAGEGLLPGCRETACCHQESRLALDNQFVTANSPPPIRPSTRPTARTEREGDKKSLYAE